MLMTKYEDLIKQRKKKSISLEAIFRKYKMSVNDVKNIQDEIENVKKEADRLMINKLAEIEALKTQLHTDRTEYQKELDRIKKENNDLYNKIADLTEALKSKDYFEKPDYKYLIDENRRLEEERNELLTDNKKLAAQIEDKINQMRRSGM